MYSRSTDRGGRRIKLPPGYDGSAFRHDTGEVRRYDGEPEMKIHSPAVSEKNTEAVERDDTVLGFSHGPRTAAEENRRILPGRWREMQGESWEGEECTEQADSVPEREAADERIPEKPCAVQVQETAGAGRGSLLEGLLERLDSEDWLLVLVILLLAADGSDAWDLILLLGVLLAVK